MAKKHAKKGVKGVYQPALMVSTGRAYNSLTRHASLFGEKSKKIISFSVKGKQCRICAAAKSKGNPPRVHQYCKNWTGSAKAMEPAMACEMPEKVETSEGKDNFDNG